MGEIPPSRPSETPRPEASSLPSRPASQSQSTDENRLFKTPTKRSRRTPTKLSREEREQNYHQLEQLTTSLGNALLNEMSRRKEQWNNEADRDEEEPWEVQRKHEIYTGLQDLARMIDRAVRDRSKDAVMEHWGRELENRKIHRRDRTAPNRDVE